ncbi:MAG: molybdopterin-dependent oxidoreductase [Thermodesulfobacteriota bacterium]
MAKFSRRTVIKGGLAGLLLSIGAKIGMGSVMEKLAPGINIARTSRRLRNGIPTTCSNCPAECGIYGYTDYGRLMKIEGVDGNPNNMGKTCSKGEAGLDMLYDEERVLTPLKRVGVRGEGKWKCISWKEATEEITSRLRELEINGTPEQLVFECEASLTAELITKRFMNAFGSPNAITHSRYSGENKLVAQRLTWGEDFEVPDVDNSKYILLFGANPYESHPFFISLAKRIVTARTENFAKLVTFDVRMTQTSGRSDEWYPVKPGTDASVVLAMCNVIIKEGLADTDFIENHTNVTPVILSRHLKDYTPEAAEQISGIPAANIIRIAREFATSKPSVAISGGGIAEHKNGVYSERCIMLLNAITGNIDAKGGYCIPRRFALRDPEPLPEKSKADSYINYGGDASVLEHASRPEIIDAIKSKGQKVGVYVSYEYNPVYSSSDSEGVSMLFKNKDTIPFFVAIDSYMTETAALADIFLPSATYLERKELFSPPSFSMAPFVSFSQPVVDPLGESRSLFKIIKGMSKKMGPDIKKYFKMSEDNFLQASISHISGLSEAGGIYYLMEHGFWCDAKTDGFSYKNYETKGFKTPSGKFEIYSERLKEEGHDPLPVYMPVEELRVQNRNAFVLVPFKTNVHTADRTANSLLLSEILHDNPLWINAGVAGEYGLQDKDKVEIMSKLGRIEAKVRITQGIHPDVVAIATNCGHWQFGHIAQAKSFESNNANTSHVWWEDEGNGIHINKIIPASIDAIGGGQGWMDTVVKIRKI